MSAILPPTNSPARRPRLPRALVIWAIAVAVIVASIQIDSLLGKNNPASGFIGFLEFLAWVVAIGIGIWGLAVAVRWVLRKLFWRVGRRLFLSYVLVGVLPFLLMAVLIFIISYMVAGVMSHAALRGERQASLGQMESWALEYGVTGKKPVDALKTLEIYDTKDASGASLPVWLRTTTFSGMVWRADQALLVCSRQFDGGRTVVFAQPLDSEWARELQEKDGMIALIARDKDHHPAKTNVTVNNHSAQIDVQDEGGMDELIKRWAFRRIIWGDLTKLTEWNSGKTTSNHQIFTLIVNPVSNLFQFYFGSSSRYVGILVNVVVGISVALLFVYFLAALFASVLIFSISRAVNRIEKGTKAVERGDFSYRIGMKPQNQLGEMAQSFDRMTESIAGLLTTVAEKERLQSEIEIAATIQRNLLPKEGPHFSGVSFSAHFEPTASIGGDYYDLFNVDKTRLGVAIGDVSGHGLSTGLVMAMVKAAMTTLVEEGADEVSLFHRLNELVYRSTERRAFMTLGFTLYDLEKGTLRHTNAGHLYPYVLRAGSVVRAVECPSLPLGIRPEIRTDTIELDLEEGDTIVYLSDGIVEAQNPTGDPFGFDQLERLLTDRSDSSPSVIRDSILHAVAQHAGTRPADDDRTIVVIRFDQFRALRLAAPVGEEAVGEVV